MLRPCAFLNSWIAPSAAFIHCEWGSVCLTCALTSRFFFWKSPLTCSWALSITIMFGTPSWLCSSESAWCAYNFSFIGNARVHPCAVQNTWAYLFFCRDSVLAINVSVKHSIPKRLYRSWQSFVWNLWDKLGWTIVCTPCCVVTFSVSFAA